ncbi:QWRF motif-containing protein 3 [Hordeum vulgare]|nr:QWRF motif-containing protein 3 [Hordeum vulgare]
MSRRWSSSPSSGAEHLPGRSIIPAATLSPLRHSARRSVSRSDTAAPAPAPARSMWPSASDGKIKKPSPSPSPLISAPSSVPTLADHLTNDAMDSADAVSVAPPSLQSLSRQRSCTELPRFAGADADADAEERKIGRSSGKSGAGHAFGRSMRFLPTSKPAGVTLTPGRVAPSDLRRLAAGYSLDGRAEVASSGSECSDASRGSSARSAIPKPSSPLIGRTSSVRLLGSSNSQWALSPGRRSSSPAKTLATVSESKGKKSLLSMGWGHLFNRKKSGGADSSIPAVPAAVPSSPVPRSNGGIGEAGHQMRMMHCRFLQWRFMNAMADAACNTKAANAEVQLMGTWARVAELRGKVARKQVQLEKGKLKFRLNDILSSQMRDLESWGQMESKHAFALESTVECAKSAICRLPLTNGAKVSLPAMASILEQMFELTMTARISVRSFSPMAQDTTVVISKLVRVATEERALLQECHELLGRLSALQIEEHSLRCHSMVQSQSLNLVKVS